MSNPLYEHRQFGKLWPLGILYLIVIVVIAAIFGDEMTATGVVSMLLGGVAIALALAVFSALTVTVDADEVQVAFGVGWPRKRIARSDIVSHDPVCNSWLHGWGIRWIKGGRLWNVWGRDAVELVLANGKKFRIGSDEPKKLNAALSDASASG
jgi:hypothetical protein